MKHIGKKFSHFFKKNLLHSAEDRPELPPLAPQEDLTEEEQAETSNEASSVTAATPVTQQPESGAAHSGGAEVNGEDEVCEDDVAVEMPPPMDEIQTHPLPSTTVQPNSNEDIHSKLSSNLSLNTKSDTTSTADLAQEIENMVKQRMPDQAEGANSSQDEGSLSGEPAASEEPEEVPEESEPESESQKYITKRKYVIEELIETERDYVRDLGYIVEGYMPVMKEGPLPEGMEGKDKMVFGNIHQIYDWHKE